MKRICLVHTPLLALMVFATPQLRAAMLDGQNIPSEGLTLRALQDTPTGFGNATGGGQDSAGGSELDALYADIENGVLKIGMTGNLEGNFNKGWIFIDAVAGGESTLANDNVDGGFNEIQNLAGLNFGGATMDHAIRLEIGGGFYSIRFADLIDNTAGDIYTGGGPGDLPLSNLSGGFGTTFGWDNSNVLGVDGSSAAGAATATTGWEFEIDMATAFGGVRNVNLTAFVTSGDGTFMSNQVLPGLGGAGNLGSPNGVTLGSVNVPVPEPSTIALAMLGLAVVGLRGRS